MNKDKQLIHVYFMPGMAANPKIFEYIQLPENVFKVHWLSWSIPLPDESLQAYTQRLLTSVKHENPVLIGVSFGGIIVQEMSKLISVRRLIIISSVKSNLELPARMKFAKKTGIYKILPTSLAKQVINLQQLPVGKSIKKRLKLYEVYMDMSDKNYLDWAIEQVLCWEQSQQIPGIIHVHGDKDLVFPIENIRECIVVPKGTHIMIINRFRWFNEHLPSLILAGKLAS